MFPADGPARVLPNGINQGVSVLTWTVDCESRATWVSDKLLM